MEQLPETEDSLVVRTDFSNSTVWETVCIAIQKPVGEFRAYVRFINDPQYDGLGPEQILSLIPAPSNRTFIFIVDYVTTSHTEHPVLVMDLYDEPGRAFRVVPSEMWNVENNLSLSNMDFEEFAESAGQDGVFRGFSEN